MPKKGKSPKQEKKQKSWVDDLRDKLQKRLYPEPPKDKPEEEWPTYLSEHRKRREEQDPTATGLTDVD